MSHNLAFGRALRKHRIRLGLSQQELAMNAGLDRTYVSLLELGHRSPTLNTLYLLCGALNILFADFAQHIDDALADFEVDTRQESQ